MKKLTLFFFALLAVCLAFQACDNSKTYAEMLEEEKDAIKAFIKDSSIVVISQSEFYAQDSTTDVSRNEYVQLASGVYMQIVDKGSTNPADTVKPNDLILVRFEEQGLIAVGGVKSYITNMNSPTVVDEFRLFCYFFVYCRTFHSKAICLYIMVRLYLLAGWLAFELYS